MPNNSAFYSDFGTKPLQKCVEINSIKEWVPEQDRRRIDILQAWRIIKSQFCAALVARGVCPIQCERCRAEIVDLFRLKEAQNPERLLTWLAKDHAARWIEKLIAEQKLTEQFPAQESLTPAQTYANLFPQAEPQNLFLEMLKDYEPEDDQARSPKRS